ncbi:MAG: hypothetical protein WDZ51_04595 [Pirellulaceae bacterium]
MNRPEASPKTILLCLIGGLALWGLYLAVGSFLGQTFETGERQYDFRRGAIVLGCMAAFLGAWARLLLRPRRARIEYRPIHEDEDLEENKRQSRD